MDFSVSSHTPKEPLAPVGQPLGDGKNITLQSVRVIAALFIVLSLFSLFGALAQGTKGAVEMRHYEAMVQGADAEELAMYDAMKSRIAGKKRAAALSGSMALVSLAVSIGLLKLKEWARRAVVVLAGFTIFGLVVQLVFMKGQVTAQQAHIPQDMGGIIGAMYLVSLGQIAFYIWIFVRMRSRKIRAVFS